MSGEQTLSGQVAIVTGSGRGIGAVVARTLAEHGASIVVADILEERAQQTADAIVANGGHALPIHVDTRDRKNVDAMIEQTVARFGRIDILVNNAGIARTATFLDTSLEDWNDHIGINLSGCFHCAQSAARVMAKAGYGRIISIASIAGLMGPLDFPAYGAAKAGVIGLTRTMALELADYGITANAIAPGPIDTELLREAWTPEAYVARAAHIPVRRLGKAEEIAYAILMLASPQAAYINGAILPVDGGAAAAGSYMSEKFRRRSVTPPQNT